MDWIRHLKSKQAAILALIIANLIWGAASPIFKWSLESISLFTLAYLRFFGASILLLPLVIKRDLTIQRPDWLKLVLLTASGITINITFFFLGLKHAPSINAPIIASSGPIILIIASIFFLKERPKPKMLLGTLISLLGVLVIIARPLLEEGFDISAVLGNLFFLLATVGAVAHTIHAKDLARRYSALTLTFWSFLLGAVSFFPFFLKETISVGLPVIDERSVTGLLFGIILSSTLAYTLYQWSVKRLEAAEVGIFTYIDPVIATIIAIPLLGEIVTPLFILGSLFVFAGIFVAEGHLPWHPIHQLHV
ncbi:MAG: DMT family transporter [Patescibacteria group bacterium]